MDTIVYVLVGFLLSGYFHIKWKYSFWQRVGLVYLEPDFIFGNIKDVILSRVNVGDHFQSLYKKMKSKGWKHGGVYELLAPVFIPLDLEIIKGILVRDFWYFPNHDGYVNEKADPMTGHLFALEDQKWKNLRTKLSPTFTSGKIKSMFHTLLACSPSLEDLLSDYAGSKQAVDIKDVVSRFTTDVIGSCAFGIECNTLKNPNSDFVYYGRKVFKFEGMRKIKNFIALFAPKWFLTKTGFKLTDDDIEKFYTDLVKNTIRYRETNNVHRKDFMHMLIQLKNMGMLADDQTLKGPKNDNVHLSVNEIVAQCFIFFIAGFETTATTMNFALYELAVNQDIQDKLREETDTVLKKHDGIISYESVMEMTYLDQIVHETLRKYPPLGGTSRKCIKDYKIPNTNIVLPKGVKVVIPIQGIHMDPEYYPHPENFDPDRFSEEVKSTRPAFTFLPFGEGPRICIGARFALLEVMVGLCIMVKRFRFTLNEKTQTPLRYSTKSFVTAAEGGIWLNVEEIH